MLIRKSSGIPFSESYQEVDNVHTITEANTLLNWLVFCFISYIFKKECHISGKLVLVSMQSVGILRELSTPLADLGMAPEWWC